MGGYISLCWKGNIINYAPPTLVLVMSCFPLNGGRGFTMPPLPPVWNLRAASLIQLVYLLFCSSAL